MRVHDAPLCVVCAHLASGDAPGDELKRNADAAEVLRRCTFLTDSQLSALGLARESGGRGVGGGAGMGGAARGSSAPAVPARPGVRAARVAARVERLCVGKSGTCQLACAAASTCRPLIRAGSHPTHTHADVGPPGHWGELSAITDHTNVVWQGDFNYR